VRPACGSVACVGVSLSLATAKPSQVQYCFVEAKSPKPIINLLYLEVAKILAQPETGQALATLGFTALGSSPEESAVRIKQEIARWARIIHDAQIERQ
jgi:tripartite-type tricarboxylate transporter receptor subunit TctC